MDVGSVGAAQPPIPLGDATPGRVVHPTVAGIREDSVGGLAQLLATPQIHDLLSGIDARHSPHGSLEAAVSAVANHDVPGALAHLAEYVRHNPSHADSLLDTPSLMPIHGQVQELLRHVTMEAKIEAEHLIATATLAVGAAAEAQRTINGPDVLAVAQRFAETGQLFNYIRASELSQAVIASYSIVVPATPSSVLHRAWPGLMRKFWRTVPLLVLLAAWFALGLMGAAISLLARVAGAALNPATVQAGFELWGVGFLALVVVQFLITVRRTWLG
jgi:hypothetical protein